MATNTLALTYDNLSQLVSCLRALLTEVCLSTNTTEKRLQLCEKLLKQHKLTPTELTDCYFVKFKVTA